MQNQPKTFVRGRDRRRGVSLLEVVIALSVLGFGMLGVAAAQISTFRAADVSKERIVAHSLARQQIEIFQGMTASALDVIAADAAYPNDPLNPIDPDPNDLHPQTFNRSWTITPDTPEADVYTITVTVAWASGLGPQTVQLEAFKSEI